MAYVALYRAYRPQKFCDVVGQQHIIKTLQNAIKLNKVAHAYLFCGPRGTGKTTLAKIMAKALNCEHGPNIEPCDECEICKGIQKGSITDVVEIDAASNNGADDIRALRDSVKYLPSVGRYKVYIIDEVHMLSNAAFNALLKTLEEPPKHVVFILATTEPYKLPNTILSRCQRFDFQAISIDDILRRLKIVAEAENIKMTEEAFNQIAASAEGGMRDALSLFDQTISYSVNDEITLDDVLAVSGNVSYIKIIELLTKCLDGENTSALKIIDSILKEGKEVPRIINDIILLLRDVLLYKNNAILEEKIQFKNPEYIKFSKSIPSKLIYSWLEELNEANNNMRFSNQKRAYLELAIIKMCDIKLNEEVSLLDRVEQLESMVNSLLENKINVKPKEEIKNIEINLPTKEELVQYTENTIQQEEVYEEPTIIEPTPVVEIKEEIVVNNDEVQIEDIEQILNTASKQHKLELQNTFKKIEEDYSGVFIAQILAVGEVVAANKEKCIVVLNDLGFCNRLMKYENFVKMMEIINYYLPEMKDYICLPKGVWNKIKIDFSKKYNPANPTVKLDKIHIGVKKRIEPTVVKKDDFEQIKEQVLECFDDNILEIVEE